MTRYARKDKRPPRPHDFVVMCKGISDAWVPVRGFCKKESAETYVAAQKDIDRDNGDLTKWQYRVDTLPKGITRARLFKQYHP